MTITDNGPDTSEWTYDQIQTWKRAAGFVMQAGSVVCVQCSSDSDLLDAHRTGPRVGPIQHPAPHGIYLHRKDSEHYDKPCAICGWAIRRGNTP